MLAWLVINLLTIGIGTILPDILAPFLDGPRRMAAFNFVVMPGAYVFILALFFVAIPSIAVKGDNVFRGLLRALKIFIRYPITCLFLSAFILAGPIFISILSSYAWDIIERFRPELVYWILVAGLGSELLANFFWMGTSVRLLAEPE